MKVCKCCIAEVDCEYHRPEPKAADTTRVEVTPMDAIAFSEWLRRIGYGIHVVSQPIDLTGQDEP